MLLVPYELPEACLYCPFTDDYHHRDGSMEIRCYDYDIKGDVSKYDKSRHPDCKLKEIDDSVVSRFIDL